MSFRCMGEERSRAGIETVRVAGAIGVSRGGPTGTDEGRHRQGLLSGVYWAVDVVNPGW